MYVHSESIRADHVNTVVFNLRQINIGRIVRDTRYMYYSSPDGCSIYKIS